MSTLIIMCGISGSGKSTKAKELKSKYNAVIISTDDIREKIFKNIHDQEHYKEVFRIAYNAINTFIELSHNVIFDATNIKYSSIKDLKKGIKYWNDVDKILCIMDTPIDKAIKQNNARDKVIPIEIIIRRANTFKDNKERIIREFKDVRFY